MGKKRNTVVVFSSDDDDDEEEEGVRSLRSSRRPLTRLKSRLSSTVPREKPRRSKKARLSGSRSGLNQKSGDWDEIRLFCEDFDEKITGLKVSDGSGRSNQKELWVDKYKPASLEELAVHKKKVEEVKIWFEERLETSKDTFSSNVLVITGQAGIGKSATIHVIASHLGARLREWNTPTPVIWQEHLYTSGTGLRYTSKLDEFENFVERIRKYGLIPSTSNKESKESVILIIDDLPVMNGKIAFGRLQNCLHLLVRSVRIPTAILITNYGEADSPDHTTRYLDELQLFLEKAGACKIGFNPITHNSTKKVLSRICRQEHCDVTAEQIDLIAKASRGDIRNAIASLQFFCLKPSPVRPLSSPGPPDSGKKPDESNILDVGFPLEFGRDENLSLFHALGKFLHNKRETENTIEMVGNEFFVQERLARLPLKMDAPETVLCQAHGQARPITDFLNENVLVSGSWVEFYTVLDFLSEEAIDDAWSIASYLGDADLLLASFRSMLVRHNEVENVLQSAAASVAVRGVLFGNSHPASPRWHSIRRPKLWEIERSSLYNKKDMVKRRHDAYYGLNSLDFSVLATEYTPLFKWLGSRASESFYKYKDVMIDLIFDGQERMISEDEIEDW